MQAFYNDPEIQKKYIDRVKAHYKADEIIQGTYWENGKGCAVGCTIQDDDVKNSHTNWHTRYEEALGVPRELAYLEDAIFEGLNNGKAKEFPLRFLNAIKLGADLSKVNDKFIIWLFSDEKEGIITKVTAEDVKKVINDTTALFTRRLNGDNPTRDEWWNTRGAAIDAIDAIAARAAIDAIDARAARAAIDAIDARAARAAIAQEARYARFEIMADKLISLIEEA